MEHGFLPSGGLRQERLVPHVPLQETEILLSVQVGQVLPVARGEVVQYRHRVALCEQLIHQIGADEACPTRHQTVHAHASLGVPPILAS